MTRFFAFLAASLLAAAVSGGEWTECGAARLAPLRVVTAQCRAFASQAKEPLMPMTFREIFAGLETVKMFGLPDESLDVGWKFYVRDDRIGTVCFWPVPGGEAAWKASRGAVPDGYRFTPDGRYVCVSDDPVLARTAASSGAPFPSPMSRGVFEAAFFGEALFGRLGPVLENVLKEMDESAENPIPGLELEDGEAAQFAVAVANIVSAFESVKVCAGMSALGIDLKIALQPRKDGANSSFFDSLPGVAMFVLQSMDCKVGAMANGAVLPRKIAKALKRAIPEHSEAKAPLFAAILRRAPSRAGGAVASKNAMPCLFCWKDGTAIKAMLRIPSNSLKDALHGMLGTDATEGDER